MPTSSIEVHALAAGRVADLLHRLARRGRDRDRAQRRGRSEFGWIDLDHINRSAIESPRQLQSGITQAAEPEDRDRFTGFESSLVQRMERGRRRTHHDRALRERDFIRKSEEAARRHPDELRIAAVAVFPDHLHLGAELLVAAQAEGTGAAVCQVIHANAVARLEGIDIAADGSTVPATSCPGVTGRCAIGEIPAR